MKLTNLLQPELIKLELDHDNKNEALLELIDVMSKTERLHDKEAFTKAIMAREAICSTGIGRGIAIPHSRNEAIKEVSIALGRSRKGIDYEALDNNLVHLIFLLAAPMNAGGVYLQALARLSRLLRDPENRQKIMDADTKEKIISILEGAE